MDSSQLQEIDGIGKSIADVILELVRTGTHKLLNELLEKTPEGILEVLGIKGLGPKKIKVLKLKRLYGHQRYQSLEKWRFDQGRLLGKKGRSLW